MTYFSFKNRIASNYIISTALLISIVFIAIYLVVSFSVSTHLNMDLRKEVDRHYKEIEVKDGVIGLKRHNEWMEHEQNMVGVEPVFIEFLDADGKLIDKSPNLKNSQLLYSPEQSDNVFFDGELVEKKIRQIQVPIFDNKKRIGHLLVAASIEESEIVLRTLGYILLFAYPLILLVLFFVARYIVGRSIKPISNIIDTSNRITRDNLKSRIPLPPYKDDLYILSDTINNLLDRVENTIEREKDFTSYASHEFRTPLAILKGTLEVLIRKPRQHEEYQEKINYCIKEIDRLNLLVDELMVLTRYENQKQSLKREDVRVVDLINSNLEQLSDQIKSKDLSIETRISTDIRIKTDTYLFSTILNNIISNAIKYSYQNGSVYITVENAGNNIICSIADNGIGIPEKDLNRIFDKFYRSYAGNNPQIKGFGLGLPIVKNFCSLLHIDIQIASKEQQGTQVKLCIPKHF